MQIIRRVILVKKKDALHLTARHLSYNNFYLSAEISPYRLVRDTLIFRIDPLSGLLSALKKDDNPPPLSG